MLIAIMFEKRQPPQVIKDLAPEVHVISMRWYEPTSRLTFISQLNSRWVKLISPRVLWGGYAACSLKIHFFARFQNNHLGVIPRQMLLKFLGRPLQWWKGAIMHGHYLTDF